MRARHEEEKMGVSPRTEGARSQVAAMREMHTLAGGEIRLQFSDIHVQRTAKTERGRQEEMTYASKQYKTCMSGARRLRNCSKCRTEPRVHRTDTASTGVQL